MQVKTINWSLVSIGIITKVGLPEVLSKTFVLNLYRIDMYNLMDVYSCLHSYKSITLLQLFLQSQYALSQNEKIPLVKNCNPHSVNATT